MRKCKKTAPFHNFSFTIGQKVVILKYVKKTHNIPILILRECFNMSRKVGTISRGVRAPIIRQGDDLVDIVTTSVLEAAASEGYAIRDRDIVAMTEAIVARAQGNYCSVDNIAEDVRTKLGGETIGVIFPILSRNRFAICLRGIAQGPVYGPL